MIMLNLDFVNLVHEICNGLVDDNNEIDITRLQSDIEEFILLSINNEAIDEAKRYAQKNGWEVKL